MIITRLIGGLGNQMFQYAASRRLACVHETELKLDFSWFSTQSLRKYELKCFNIKEHYATSEDIGFFSQRPKIFPGKALRKVTCTLFPSKRRVNLRERHFHLDPLVLDAPKNSYLIGYWQSEKYFKDIEDIIRQDFTVKTPQTGKDKELAEMIASCESVSLHIRRGDYVSNPHTNQAHGICNLKYYFCCVEHLTQTVKNPHFFIFSDEPEWARDNLTLSCPATFVDHNKADKNYEDLRLMSQCKHHIIANSSFSWWGGLVESRPG